MLFAAGEPVEAEKIADILQVEKNDIIKMMEHLSAQYDERNSGICLICMEGKYQLCTRVEYNQEVRALLEVKKNVPLSQAAFEVLAVVAYNQPVTRAFIEQVRGVDCSGPVSGLVQKGLIEEKGRLDLPGRPLVYGTTDQFLRCFSISSLDELPELPNKLENSGGQIEGQTSLTEMIEEKKAPDPDRISDDENE